MSAIWEGRRVVLCAGTGGVGKTTVSAAIGLAAAASGRRTLVMTIDPARRLANALGLTRFGNVEREVSAVALQRHGVELEAPLWAMMPDVKRTFDELITRIAPTEERRGIILGNRFYQQFSTVLAGSLEYAAVEKLYEVYKSDRYDLIVLDTPPAQNAMDFLNAPGRVLDFLDHESWKWLQKPYALAGRLSIKLMDLGGSFILRTLGRLAGGEVISELAQFITGFQGTYDGFRERSRAVRNLLSSDELGFVLVTSTQPDQVPAMLRFRSELEGAGMKVSSVIINRVRPDPFSAVPREELDRRIAGLVAPLNIGHRELVRDAVDEEVALAGRAAHVVESLRKSVGELPVTILPELPLDAHDLESLARLYGAFLPAQAASRSPGSVDTPTKGEG